MADIFVSYARADRRRVAPLVRALEGRGWSVWWDPEITPGQEFDTLIATQLKQAKAVVVVWSPAAVQSRWVRGEARLGADRGILVPVRFDDAELPIDALSFHTTDLDEWNEDPESRPFLDLVRALRALLTAADPSPAATERSDISICVLPFANMSEDPEQEYFSDGISEDIITDLSKVSALTVISRNSAFAFKGRSVHLPDVARRLKASHVLEGSVRKAGRRVRITAQLIDGRTNTHLWADRWDRDLEDIFALQDEISRAVVDALKLKLLAKERQAIGDRGTSNLEAYDLYLRANALHMTYSGVQIRRSLDLYRRAVALDPDFAQAWAGVAGAINRAAVFLPEHFASERAEMEHALARAFELGPDLPEVLTNKAARALGAHDWVAADQLASKLVDARRTDGITGLILVALGRAEEGVSHLRALRDRDPLALFVSLAFQSALECAARIEEAEAEYERSRDLSGSREVVEWHAVMRLMASGDDALLRRRFIAAFSEDTAYMPFHPALAKVVDRPDEALAILRDAYEDPACQDSARLGVVAAWAAYCGDEELALKALRRGIVETRGGVAIIWIWNPAFARLRRRPEFKEIIRKIGLVDHWRRSGRWGDFARPAGEDDFEIIR